MDLSTDELAKAREQMRAAWRAQHPGASEAEMPAALRDPAARQHNGLLVALWLPASTAAQLALPGGEPPDALHVTLCYCGDVAEMDELTIYRAINAVDRTVNYRPPLEGRIGGYGRFSASESSDGREVFYAAVDVPDLAEMRAEIARELTWAGVPPRATHGFTPHISLAYLEPGAPNPVETVPTLPLRFSAVTIKAGERTLAIPLGGFPSMLYSAAEHGASWRLFSEVPQGFADAPPWMPLLPTPGVFAHPLYGQIVITADRNARMVQHINDRVYGQDLPVDAEHETKLSGAFGWIKEARLNEDGSADARVEWTDRGIEACAKERFRYVSPEWYEVWTDPMSGEQFEDVVIGAAITTRPFFKPPYLRPLVATEGQLYAAKPGDAGPWPAMERLQAAEPKEGDVSDQNEKSERVQLTEAEVLEFRDLKARHAEREQAFAEQAAKLTELEVAKTANEAKVAALETERRERTFADLVRGRGGENDGAAWPGAVADNVSHLLALAEAVGEDSPVFTAHVARMNEAARTLAEALKPIGTTVVRDPVGGTALAQLQARARTYAEEHKVTPEQAFVAVADANPELVAAYEQGE